jgi:hypothetical protein
MLRVRACMTPTEDGRRKQIRSLLGSHRLLLSADTRHGARAAPEPAQKRKATGLSIFRGPVKISHGVLPCKRKKDQYVARQREGLLRAPDVPAVLLPRKRIVSIVARPSEIAATVFDWRSHRERGLTGMSGSERLDSKIGPLGNLSQAWSGNFDMIAKGFEPALKGAARWNLELMGFMARRAQAWLEIPSRASQCKTPADLLQEQSKFWQAATADYVDASKRLAATWSAGAYSPKLNGSQPRDYITFAEPQESSAAPKRGDRKAA